MGDREGPTRGRDRRDSFFLMRRAGLVTYVNRKNRAAALQALADTGERNDPDHHISASGRQPCVGRAHKASSPAAPGIPDWHEHQRIEANPPERGKKGNSLGQREGNAKRSGARTTSERPMRPWMEDGTIERARRRRIGCSYGCGAAPEGHSTIAARRCHVPTGKQEEAQQLWNLGQRVRRTSAVV